VTEARTETDAAPTTGTCPGCGAVLAEVPGLAARHPGASAACARLFEVTVRGLRDDAARDAAAAALLQLATDVYDAQHLVDGGPTAPVVRLELEVDRGVDPQRAGALVAAGEVAVPERLTPPARWATTLADIAADLDVVDLPALVRSWAESVWADWSAGAADVLRSSRNAGSSLSDRE
jgi:Family of unknown function (DUF5946)